MIKNKLIEEFLESWKLISCKDKEKHKLSRVMSVFRPM